jgi:hypothetical protein
MLGDSILIIIGMLLVVMGSQPMLEESNRSNSVNVINSTTMVIMGIFIIFYWNTIVP